MPRLGRWTWSADSPLPAIDVVLKTARVWTSEVYEPLRRSLGQPQVRLSSADTGQTTVAVLELRMTANAPESVKVALYCSGKVPSDVGPDAFRAAVVLATLSCPDILLGVLERGVPVLLYGGATECRATVREVRRHVPTVRERRVAL